MRCVGGRNQMISPEGCFENGNAPRPSMNVSIYSVSSFLQAQLSKVADVAPGLLFHLLFTLLGEHCDLRQPQDVIVPSD